MSRIPEFDPPPSARPTRFQSSALARLPRIVAVAALALVAFVATPSSGGPPISRFDALPQPNERLAQPVWLPHCGMKIVEWRSTSALKAETTATEQAYQIIDDTCRNAFDQYAGFLRARKLPRLRDQANALPSISLLPGNVLLDGKSLRALNDLPSRFEAVAPGCCYWGLYVDSLNHLFLRNDPLIKDESGKLVPNPRFVRTLTHEISHVLSSRLGVWDVVGYDRQRDEDLAEDFVGYMGMHFPAESSAEDLAYHRGRMPYAPPGEPAAPSVLAKAQPPAPAAASASANTSPQPPAPPRSGSLSPQR
jgi:hypothetical protein